MIRFHLKYSIRQDPENFNLDCRGEIHDGEAITLYGKSGAGKSTLLRCLSGLIRPDAGTIYDGDRCIYDSEAGIFLPARSRHMSLLFQDYALFPNMTVEGNIRFGMKKGEDASYLKELMDVMNITALRGRYPRTLSGGEQQRTALARALAARPSLLLLDEPLAALDYETRLRLQDYLLEIQKRYGLTLLLVSHDPSEILRLSQRVFVMEAGKISGEPSAASLFSSKHISGKFRFAGHVISVDVADVICIVMVQVDSSVVRVVADREDVKDLKPGDRVMIASKAFNPILVKI